MCGIQARAAKPTFPRKMWDAMLKRVRSMDLANLTLEPQSCRRNCSLRHDGMVGCLRWVMKWEIMTVLAVGIEGILVE